MARPITKADRTKVGLSLENIAVETLAELSANTGKSKSRIVEESIALYMKDKIAVDEKMKKIDKLGDQAFASIDEIFANDKIKSANKIDYYKEALEN